MATQYGVPVKRIATLCDHPKVRVKPRSADQTSALHFRDLRFCCQKNGLCSAVSDFPRTSGKRGNIERPEAKATTNSTEKQPLKRKNRLSAVPAGQAGRNVARPHQRWTIRNSPTPVNPLPRSMRRIKPDQPPVSKVTSEQKNTRVFVFSQPRCKF